MGSAALDSSVLSVCMSGAYTIDGADGVATGGSWGGIKTADAGYSFVSSGLECIKTKDHVWTAPAVQEESDVLRSVRVQPCMRPVFA